MNFLKDISVRAMDRHRNSPAIIGKDYEITYGELKTKIFSAAGFLTNEKIVKNEPVAVLSGNSPDFIVLVLALWLIDAVPVPINTRLTKDEIKKLVKIAGCKKIFLHRNYKKESELKSVDNYYFPFESKTIKGDSLLSNKNLGNTAVIIFTSGSSGIPKGVALSFRNLVHNTKTGDQVLRHAENEKWLASLPFYHIGGFSIITRALLYGASIIIPETLETESLKFSFENQGPTLASLVGTQLKRLLELNTTPGKELKNLLLGGGFIDNELIKSAIKKGWNISKVYGSSETSSFVTMLAGNELALKIDSAGKALSPNKIFILDDKGQKLPDGETGEIVIQSDAVMLGYINNEEETRKKLKDGLYYTGDIGYLDSEGYLFVEARRNDLIISGGENINPDEIKKAILDCPMVKDCFVLGLEDKTWGHIVAAAVVKANRKSREINLTEFLKTKIAGFKIPKKIIYVDRIPKTPLGKIEKNKVIELFN